MAVSDTLTSAADYARRNPKVAAGVGAGVVVLGAWAYLGARRERSGATILSPQPGVVGSTATPTPPAAPTPPAGNPIGQGPTNPGRPIAATLPGFPSGYGPPRVTKPRSNLERMPEFIVGNGSGDTDKRMPGERIDPKGKPYTCPKGSFLTWERGKTGNQVCQKPDGTQFAVVPVKAKK